MIPTGVSLLVSEITSTAAAVSPGPEASVDVDSVLTKSDVLLDLATGAAVAVGFELELELELELFWLVSQTL